MKAMNEQGNKGTLAHSTQNQSNYSKKCLIVNFTPGDGKREIFD